MKRELGRRPLGLASTVPCQGKNCAVTPLSSFWYSPSSVSEVAALGRQVSEGAISARSSGTWSTCVPALRDSATRR